MSRNLNHENVHGIGFSGSRMENTCENKVKVLNQIKKRDVTVEDAQMSCLVLHIHKYDDYIDVFYSEDTPEQAIQQMRRDLHQGLEEYGQQFFSTPLRASIQLCREIHEPELPDIESNPDVLAYLV